MTRRKLSVYAVYRDRKFSKKLLNTRHWDRSSSKRDLSHQYNIDPLYYVILDFYKSSYMQKLFLTICIIFERNYFFMQQFLKHRMTMNLGILGTFQC